MSFAFLNSHKVCTLIQNSKRKVVASLKCIPYLAALALVCWSLHVTWSYHQLAKTGNYCDDRNYHRTL